MTIEDVAAVVDVVQAADDDASRRAGRDPDIVTDEQRQRVEAGMRRFIQIDPQGAWVAVDDRGVVGMAEAIRRDRFWGLSMLFVDPRGQNRGIGRRLLDKTLAYADGADVRMIMASEDSRALRRYSRAGLSIHPAVEATGTVDRTRIPADLTGREGTADDLDIVKAVEQSLGRTRTDDVAAILHHGWGRLEIVDRDGHLGYGVHHEGRVRMLGATDDDTAATVLWRLLAHAQGKAEVWGLTAGQDWAVRVALEAGLVVRGSGPLFVSGLERPPAAWIPSGWYF